MNKEFEEEERKKEEEEAARLDKVPKTLLGDDGGQTEREHLEKLCLVRNGYAEKEKENAQHFVSTLQDLLPSILRIKSSISVDIALQEFASNYCDGMLWFMLSKRFRNVSDEK